MLSVSKSKIDGSGSDWESGTLIVQSVKTQNTISNISPIKNTEKLVITELFFIFHFVSQVSSKKYFS